MPRGGLARGKEIAIAADVFPETVLNQNLLRLSPRSRRIAKNCFHEPAASQFPGISGQAVDKLTQAHEIFA
jgi:hypothetical protein